MRQVRSLAAAAVVAAVVAATAVAAAPSAAAEQEDENDDDPEAAVTISTEHKRTFLRTFIKKFFRKPYPVRGTIRCAVFSECALTITHPGRLSHSMPCERQP